ncbi:protein transport protein Sec31B isoform X2 [Carettochelys insculpta]|uniref:protein transport protein Sec31B isoform X2 n=1 Tax=Carettochelys insculpta TaxID=44489 RepID=UPI003EBA15C5
MKLKEIERTAVQVWSPPSNHPIYLATGTSAQQLDASFSTNATLEIFEIDFRDPSLDMKCRGILPTSNRFHKLIWGSFGNRPSDCSGVIVGGGDNGVLTLFSASQILTSGAEPVIGRREKHTGPVRALDINPIQCNLLASGANNSEIYIWDLNNFSVPMAPRAKSQPQEDVSAVSWNRQVQHILSSAHPSGKAVVWDLRKNEPIIKVSDHSNRMHCSGMAWHPEVATQLVLSSESDHMPVIQLWDLRFATSPLSQLEGHSRGVLSISWCQADPELLLSSAKDNRILCWNPCIGEVVYELPTQSQWCFDVQWCPRNPSVFSAASFDGWINVYSVMGGNLAAQQKTQADKISSSFDTLEPFGSGQTLPPLRVPEEAAQTTLIPPLRKPPKWIRRPVGASFAFGGKLITFGLTKAPAPQRQQSPPRQVFISQVVTETEFLARSRDLQSALQSGNLVDYCQHKIRAAQLPFEESIWSFLKANAEPDSRSKLLRLLGYRREELQKKITSYVGSSVPEKQPLPEADGLAQATQPIQGSRHSLTEVGAASSSSGFFDSLLPQDTSPLVIPVTTDTDGLISQALLVGNFAGAVELCMCSDRFADAIILAVAGGEKLLRETQRRYFAKRKTEISQLLSSIVQQKWSEVVCSCALQSWKEALAVLLTYSKQEEYAQLCDTLGARLESAGEGALSEDACLCYVSSGNVERLAKCWARTHQTSSPLALQDLLEMVMVLSKTVEVLRGSSGPGPGPVLAELITQYASLLASQGCLAGAMSYLPHGSEQLLVQQLRDRLFHAQGASTGAQEPRPFPYAHVHVRPASRPPAAAKSSLAPGGPGRLEGPMEQPPFTPPVSGQPSVPLPNPPQLVLPQPGMGPPPSTYARAGAQPHYFQNAPSLSPATALGPVSQPAPFLPGARPTGIAAFPSQPGTVASHSVPPPGPAFFRPASVPAQHPGAGRPPLLFPAMSFSGPPGLGYPQGGPGAPSVPPPPTGQEPWKDPAALRGGLQKKKVPETFAPLAPITAPVMSVSAEPWAPLPQPARGQQPGQAPPGAPKEGSMQLPTERIERKELPPEHQGLKTTFEGLVQRCTAVATDPKTKRKLEEAGQRLECLYEKLREQALSPHILVGLQEIARCVEARSYQQGLQLHSQLVGGSSFSEVSGFMPILKVLLTVASRLPV